MTNTYHNPDRTVLRVSGADHIGFLEGLVSNAIAKTSDGAVYAAILSPQGKFMFDFIMTASGDAILLDVRKDRAQPLAMRLSMYRLRADVAIEDSGLSVIQGFSDMPEGAFVDPRNAGLGWRKYGDASGLSALPSHTWNALRIEHSIPETGVELTDDTYILEAGFEALNGVDFRKGCYVGQEITARMKHKTELKKGLVRVSVQGDAPSGTPITFNDKPAGTLFTVVNGQGLAHLRFDRANAEMKAGDAVVTRV